MPSAKKMIARNLHTYFITLLERIASNDHSLVSIRGTENYCAYLFWQEGVSVINL